MDVIYSLIPGMMFFGLIFLVVLIWAVKKGQYEDMEGMPAGFCSTMMKT